MSAPITKAAGNLAIVWGTTNAANAGANIMPTGAIIETITVTPKNGDPVDIEDGAGFTQVQVLANDGFSAKATVVYDSNKAMPTEGANVTFVAPKAGNTGTLSYTCTFWSWGFAKARKKEQMVDLNFTYRPDLNGAPS